MGRAFTPAVCVYLLLLGLGSAWLADAAWKSVTEYRPTYAIERELPSGEPAVERLVLIVADGVRADAADSLPTWQALAARGASGVVEAPEPSLSNPARATLTTGALPEIHGVTHNGFKRPPAVQSLFSAAQRTGVPTAAYGGSFWTRAYGPYLDEFEEFEKELHVVDDPAELIAWQRETCDAMVPWLAERPRGLVAAGLTAGDSAGHDFGGESDAYRQTLQAVDGCLGRIVEALEAEDTAFLVVSDHGHIHRRSRGGHGGREPEVLHAPFVLAGAGVSHVENLRGDMRDIAPTAALLLGLPLPANNQGEPFWTAIGRTPEREARLDRQRGLERGAVPDRADLVAQERSSRAPLGTALLAWFAVVVIGGLALDRKPWPDFALALGLFFLLYFWLFWALGLGYSLSAIIRQEYTNSFFLRNMAAAALAFVAARRLLRVSDASRTRRRALLLAVVVTALFGLRAAWIFTADGLLMQSVTPNLEQAFTAYLDLLAIFGVALIAIFLTVFAGLIAIYRRSAGARQ